MKLLVVLLVLPCVLAGDFAKMWAEVEKELQTKGWGEEPKGWGDEHKGWGEEPKGWGEEHKGWSAEKNETDKKQEEKSKEEKYNEEHKGWGEEHKGWGANENASNAENKTKLFEDFKSWLTQQEKHKKEQEEYKEDLKINVEQFKEYMRMKHYQELQEEEAKEAIKKEMERVQVKKLLTEKLYNVSNEYLAQKMKFTQEITTQFLEFCQCDNSKDFFERVTKGHFGDVDSADYSWDYDGSMEERDNETNNGNVTVVNGGSSSYNNTPSSEGGDKMKATVMWFAKLSPKEQAKHVQHDLVKVMCTAATHYLGEIKEIEAALIYYKKKYHHHE